jgi:hypothetical protein
MDTNTILLILFVVVMALCCGPMMFMRGRRRNHKPSAHEADKPSSDIEPK